MSGADATESAGAQSVTQLELFFDLVFVFTITQLTTLLSSPLAALTWRNLWHAAVMLGLIFWMYDGYAWLTNAVPARGTVRERLLLCGMAGYLVLAISVPDAFHGTGLTFGLAFLLITSIHAFLYVTGAGESSAQAMRELAPWNLLAAAVVLVSGAIGGTTQEVCWTLVFIGLWFATRTGAGFEIQPAHFVERHGLLVVIAIGEAVVSTGVAARHVAVTLTVCTAAALGLLLSAELWWSYFGNYAGSDDTENEVERAFAATTGPDRPRVAFLAFGYAFYMMLFGVILTAVGLKPTINRPDNTLSTGYAFALTAGTVIFLLGITAFRTILSLKTRGIRSAAPLLLLLAIPLATNISALAALAALTGSLWLLLATNERVRKAGARPRPERVRAEQPGEGTPRR